MLFSLGVLASVVGVVSLGADGELHAGLGFLSLLVVGVPAVHQLLLLLLRELLAQLLLLVAQSVVVDLSAVPPEGILVFARRDALETQEHLPNLPHLAYYNCHSLQSAHGVLPGFGYDVNFEFEPGQQLAVPVDAIIFICIFGAIIKRAVNSEFNPGLTQVEVRMFSEKFTEDVYSQPNLRSKDNEVRTDKWQESYMKQEELEEKHTSISKDGTHWATGEDDDEIAE